MHTTDQQASRSEACCLAPMAMCWPAETVPRNPQVSYYRARYYDQATGRFLSEDPIGFMNDDDINLYTYVQNSPASLVDPSGLQHSPGGPDHPGHGVKFACLKTDICPVLSAKIEIFKGLIVGHLVWDALNNHPGRHTDDVTSFIKGLGECIRIHRSKCTDKPCPPNPPVVPIPAPEPQREPFRVPVPPPAAAGQAAATAGIAIIILRILFALAAAA